MRYEIEFISKYRTDENDCTRNSILSFGQDNIKAVAEKCFEYGKTGRYTDIIFKRIKKETDDIDWTDKNLED